MLELGLGILCWRYDIVFYEVFHKLIIDDGVEYFCYDW